MAFAIASGLEPAAGLWTAIIAGLLISLLGGTSVQIGGPAGAFIVIVYGIVERYGLANLLISTLCAGVLLFLLGWFRLGTLVRYVPVSVVIGFTNGIAVLIGLSQLRDAFGLQVEKMPADFSSRSPRSAGTSTASTPGRLPWRQPACWACSCGHGCGRPIQGFARSWKASKPSVPSRPRRGCRRPSSRWSACRCSPGRWSCRSRPSARVSVASRRACPASTGRRFPGKRSSNWWCPR